MLDDDGDAVRFVVDRAEEIFVAELRERSLSELLVFAKRSQRVFEIMLAERLSGHFAFVSGGFAAAQCGEALPHRRVVNCVMRLRLRALRRSLNVNL